MKLQTWPAVGDSYVRVTCAKLMNLIWKIKKIKYGLYFGSITPFEYRIMVFRE